MGSFSIALILVIVVSLFAAAILALIPASIAQSKGRGFWEWYVYALLLFLVALIHSLLIKPSESFQRRELAIEGYKACPFCDEMIRPNAVVCRYCGRELSQASGDEWSPDADEAADRAWRQVERD